VCQSRNRYILIIMASPGTLFWGTWRHFALDYQVGWNPCFGLGWGTAFLFRILPLFSGAVYLFLGEYLRIGGFGSSVNAKCLKKSSHILLVKGWYETLYCSIFIKIVELKATTWLECTPRKFFGVQGGGRAVRSPCPDEPPANGFGTFCIFGETPYLWGVN